MNEKSRASRSSAFFCHLEKTHFFLNRERIHSSTTAPTVPTSNWPQNVPLAERPSKLKIQLPNKPPTIPTMMQTKRPMPLFMILPAMKPAKAPISNDSKIPIVV